MLNRTRDNDTGAVAVVVAICATLLLGVGALAVDLGNAFARKRATQTDADFAALAGGAHLPDASAAFDAAYDYLQRNLPGGGAMPAEAVLADGDVTNGEIDIVGTTRIEVTAPPRLVNYGLAAVFGHDSAEVSAFAAVEIRSPAMTLPLSVAFPCRFGAQIVRQSSNGGGNNGGGSAEPDWHPRGGGQRPTITSVTPAEIDEGDTASVTITGNRLTPGTVVHLIGETQVAATVSSATATQVIVTVPSTLAEGTWYVQVQNSRNGGGWSDQNESFTVTVGNPSTDPGDADCDSSSTGNFGQLDSPRSDVSQNNWVGAWNFAYGLDHALNEFPGALPPPDADQTCAGLQGAILDGPNPVDGANCINVSPGLSMPVASVGLITGDQFGNPDARLATGSSCTSGPDRITVLGRSVNNDQLSCYLPAGVSLGDLLTSAGAGRLNGAVVESPRFFIIPVFNTEVLPQNSGGGGQAGQYYPIESFVGGFITDEQASATRNNPVGVTATNGFLTGPQQLQEIHAFLFPLTALPESIGNNGGSVPYIGSGPRIPVLVD